MRTKFKLPLLYKPIFKKDGKAYSGKTYVCNLPLWACPDGKRYFNTGRVVLSEAKKEVEILLKQRDAQSDVFKTYDDADIDSVIESYLNAKTGKARKTFMKYKQVVTNFRNYAVKELGCVPKLQDITKPLAEGFLANLLKKGQCSKTYNVKRNVLTNLFNYAESNNWVSRNIIRKIPKETEEERSFDNYGLTFDEALRVLKELKKDSCKLLKNFCYYEIMAVIYYAGLRISEVTHLFKTDIDFNTHTIFVHNKMIGNKKYTTKTRKNWRPRMNGELEAILRDWLEKTKGNESELLFPSTKNTPIKTDYVALRVKKMMARIGIPKEKISRPCHRGRHTFSSLAQESGISESDVQGALGHSSNVMTKHYTHLSDEYKKNQFDKLSLKNKGLASEQEERNKP